MNPAKTFILTIILALFMVFSLQPAAGEVAMNGQGTTFASDVLSFHPVNPAAFYAPAGQSVPPVLQPDSNFLVVPGIPIIGGQPPVYDPIDPASEFSTPLIESNKGFLPAPSVPSPMSFPSENLIPGFSPVPSFDSLPISSPEDTIPGSDPVPVPGIVPVTPASPPVELDVVDANNRFALDLYKKLSQDPGFNEKSLFFSPFSISTAFAIAYEGARGSTADEIQSVFHFPKDDGIRREEFAELISGINNGDADYTLSTANALWAEMTYPFLPEYISTAERYYSARVTNLDVKNNTEASRITINSWVEDLTNNRIQDLIPSGALDQLTRLVITNAVYFKGTWEKQFDETQTKQDFFTVSPGTTASVQMMQRTDPDATFNYAEADLFQALEMPYAHESGKQLSMLVILPKGNNLAAVESSLNTLDLSDLRDSLTLERVNVFFPKFRLDTTYNLPGTLAAMGMPTAFTDSADFSGMGGTSDLKISEVIHKAFIDVNEEGTEAAAATAIEMRATGAISHPVPIPVFKADHPFLFLIVDDETGSVLFIGRMINPNG
ncbi:MAG: serpin family protein [Methanomicrobiales archaeon]|nr:serpin family protein [Methanomicrobiales archaeon]